MSSEAQHKDVTAYIQNDDSETLGSFVAYLYFDLKVEIYHQQS